MKTFMEQNKNAKNPIPTPQISGSHRDTAPELRGEGDFPPWRRRVPPRQGFHHFGHPGPFSTAFLGLLSDQDPDVIVSNRLSWSRVTSWNSWAAPGSGWSKTSIAQQHEAGKFQNFLPAAQFPFPPGSCLAVPSGIGSVLTPQLWESLGPSSKPD